MIGQSWSEAIASHDKTQTFWHVKAEDLVAYGDFCADWGPRWIEGGAFLDYPAAVKSVPGPRIDLTSSKTAQRKALDQVRANLDQAGAGPLWVELAITEPGLRADVMALHQQYPLAGLCHWGPLTADVVAAYPADIRRIVKLGPDFADIEQALKMGADILFTEAPAHAARANQRWGEGDCACSTCRDYSPAVLEHLFHHVPLLAIKLNFIHNSYYLNNDGVVSI